LYGVARNVTRNRLRRDRRFVALDTVSLDTVPAGTAAATRSPASDDPCDAASRAEQRALLRRTVLSLPSRYREVIILSDVHGLAYAESARILRVPVGTVRSRLSRGRQMLAARLDAAAAPVRTPPQSRIERSRIERCVV
jgi:RNA polymerase sigma-70 factor (ECF subfamily)